MINQKIKICNRYGIHARPSSMIADLASQFQSLIMIEKDGKEVDARSIMDLILLCVEPDSTITLKIDGNDEKEALQAFIDLIEVRLFDEISEN